jgi:hypothetical protein
MGEKMNEEKLNEIKKHGVKTALKTEIRNKLYGMADNSKKAGDGNFKNLEDELTAISDALVDVAYLYDELRRVENDT